jgi:aquaporin Z
MTSGINKAIVEFIGAFFLVFTIGMVVLGLDGVKDAAALALAPVAIGAVLMVMIFAGGHISGAHFNPAVSLAVFLRGKATSTDLLTYIVAQVVGAIVAGLLVLYLKGFPTVTPISPDPVKALLAEFLFTFALCWVVLNVATSRGTTGNSFYGLAIGFTVLAGAYAVGGVSGGAFNPAVAVGITVMGISPWLNIWIYLLANLVAAAAAAYAFRFLSTEDQGAEVVPSGGGAAARPAPASNEAARRRRR